MGSAVLAWEGLGKPEHSQIYAEKFADNPGIVGYDMLNEPFGDEALQISPLYEDVAARIRKHDTKAILFVEPQASARTCQSCLRRLTHAVSQLDRWYRMHGLQYMQMQLTGEYPCLMSHCCGMRLQSCHNAL